MTYEYICKDCKLDFILKQSIRSRPLILCPNCGGAVERVITGGNGVIFKGHGFYITDNKKGIKNG